MIIVSGHLTVNPSDREELLGLSVEPMETARGTPGCRAFIVAADPLLEDRVNIYEEWETREALETFRGEGPRRRYRPPDRQSPGRRIRGKTRRLPTAERT